MKDDISATVLNRLFSGQQPWPKEQTRKEYIMNLAIAAFVDSSPTLGTNK
jgi:hypothetical protein